MTGQSRVSTRIASSVILAATAMLAYDDTITGAEFYVVVHGDDQADGARERPFASFQRAQQAARKARAEEQLDAPT